MSTPVQAAARSSAVLILLAALTMPAGAQWFPGFGGIEGRVGALGPEQARSGLSAGLDLDLGSVRWYRLHVLLGGNYFRAETERVPDGGRITGVGGRAALRLDLVELAAFRPYLLAQVNGHDVNASDVSDVATRDLLQGFYAGAGVGAGFAFDLGGRDVTARNRTSAVVELRRVFTNNISHWAAEIGLRFQRRVERPVVSDAEWLERERRRIAGERDRSLLELERRRAEEEARTDEASRAAAERAEAERAAAAARTDTAVARSQAEAERLRQEALRAEDERRREADARARAEEEAAASATRAREAEAAARAATERAAEAERRMRDALRELDRILANVSAVRETERGLIVVFGAGMFASGQSALSAAARADVGRLAAVLQQHQNAMLTVEGHTDATGSEALNQRLSEQRAEAVRAALIAEGIAPNRVSALGYGQSRPIESNETAAGRAANRRVEVVIAPGGA